jgi:hypothetical protein
VHHHPGHHIHLLLHSFLTLRILCRIPTLGLVGIVSSSTSSRPW